MPIYEYQCEDCSCLFELKQSFSDNSVVYCPQCRGKTTRIFSPVPIIFKGPGFYVTDNAAAEKNRLKDRGNRPVDTGKEIKPPKEHKKKSKS